MSRYLLLAVCVCVCVCAKSESRDQSASISCAEFIYALVSPAFFNPAFFNPAFIQPGLLSSIPLASPRINKEPRKENKARARDESRGRSAPDDFLYGAGFQLRVFAVICNRGRRRSSLRYKFLFALPAAACTRRRLTSCPPSPSL
jgi:hypothetical protein